MREKVRKSRNTVLMICGSGGRKVGSPLWREAHLEIRGGKTRRVRSTFGNRAVERVHAVVAPSTCGSENVQNTFSEHFWKLRCRRSARKLVVRSTFGSCPDVEKVHAVVARSTLASKKG